MVRAESMKSIPAEEVSALEELVQLHGAMVYGACRRILRNHHDAEDATQAAFLVLMRKGNAKNWSAGQLHRIAVFCAQNVRVIRRRRIRHEMEAGKMGEDHREYLNKEIKGLLDDALLQLSESQRTVLVLRYLEGLPQRVVAQQLGCSEETVHSRVRLGLEKLRRQLKRHDLEISGAILVSILENVSKSTMSEKLLGALSSFFNGGNTPSFTPDIASQKVINFFWWSQCKTWSLAACLLVSLFALTPFFSQNLNIHAEEKSTHAELPLSEVNKDNETNVQKINAFTLRTKPGQLQAYLNPKGNSLRTNHIVYSLSAKQGKPNPQLEFRALNAITGNGIWGLEIPMKVKPPIEADPVLIFHEGKFFYPGPKEIICFSEENRKLLWRLTLPPGQILKKTAVDGDKICVAGNDFIGLVSAESGQIIWWHHDQQKALRKQPAGILYAGPFIYKDVVCTVFNQPGVIEIRSLKTGITINEEFLSKLKNEASRKDLKNFHVPTDPEMDLPVAFHHGLLLLTDGLELICFNVASQKYLWKLRWSKLDKSRGGKNIFQFWLQNEKLFIQKNYYSVQENALLSSRTGELFWRRREGGVVVPSKHYKYDASVGKPSIGVVLKKAIVCKNSIVGITDATKNNPSRLEEIDLASGNSLVQIKDMAGPNAIINLEKHHDKKRIWIRIRDGAQFKSKLFNPETKIIEKTISYALGQNIAVDSAKEFWQGPYLILQSSDEIKVLPPQK